MLAIGSVLFIFISWRVNGTSKSFECDLILSCLTKYFAEKEVVISNSTDIYFKVYEKGNLFHNMRNLLHLISLSISQFAFPETWLEHPRRFYTDADCPKIGVTYNVRCMHAVFGQVQGCSKGSKGNASTSLYASPFLWMSLVFVKLGGPDVSNGTLPKPLVLCGSTKVGFTSIHAFYFEIWFQTSGVSMDGERNKNDCFNNLI